MSSKYHVTKKYKRNGNTLDLIGERFGRLIVTGRAPDIIDKKSQKHKSCWYCDCDCGTKNKIVIGSALTSGAIRSCGCLHDEVASEHFKKSTHGKKYNKYDLDGEFGIGYTNKGEEFYFDLEDYDKIKDICWHMDKGYLIGRDIENQQDIRMHRLINEPSDYQVVDHINGCRYDNRKQNLRNTSQKYNARNRKAPNNNTSGTMGVSYFKPQNRWKAYIIVDNKQIFLGYYDDIEEAIEARKNAEIKYFKEFRREEIIDETNN